MTEDMARASTLRKFNPGALQDDEEIIRQFVVREHQLELILEVLCENLGAASNQHLLVVATRGRGKTMLLARVAAELRRDPELVAGLFPVRFMEESMEVLGIADFWLECLLHLANALTPGHPERAEALRETRASLAEILDEQALEQRARAAVLDVADALDRRLVLIVENLQDLESDADPDFGWQLRKLLQGEPRIMVLASATCRFAGLDQADQPFFETFREIALPALDADECCALWRTATGEAIGEREITPLKILTGGSPRLLIFMAGFARHHSMRQLMEELVTLVDDHTEYFRGHLEAFAAKERKVYLALIDLWQPSTAREVATRARMDIRPVSSLLGRLVNRGAVILQPGGKQKQYSVAERLYSIYYKLRRERNEAAVVQGLVRFMAAFYTGPDLQTLVDSLTRESRETPGIRQGVVLAMRTDHGARERLLGCLSFDDYTELFGVDADTGEWIRNRMSLANAAYSKAAYDEALVFLNEVVERFGDSDTPALKAQIAAALYNRGVALAETNRLEEAITSFLQLVERFGSSDELELRVQIARALFTSGALLEISGRSEEALSSYSQVIELFGNSNEPALKEQVAKALVNRGVFLEDIHQRPEALASYERVIKRFGYEDAPALQEQLAIALFNRGVLLAKAQQPEKALASFSQIIKLFGDREEPVFQQMTAEALVNRGAELIRNDRLEDALSSYEQVLKRFGEANESVSQEPVAAALFNSGLAHMKTGQLEKALDSFTQVVKRFGAAATSHLQAIVANAVSNSPYIEDPKITARLYAEWYQGVPIENPEVIRVFQAVTAFLYVTALPVKTLLQILESDTTKREQVRPLIVALRLENGEQVRAPAEILEVAADVRKQFIQLRESRGQSNRNETPGTEN